ncbi:MAG: c-type cytochrome [Betaproteobacteria bacterium]
MTRSIRSALVVAFAFAAGVAVSSAHAAGPAPFKVPDDATIPKGPEGDAIKLGRAVITDTKKRLPNNVGNGLACTHCHLAAGTTPEAGPFVGLWGVFPEYRSRNGQVNSMQQRINDCFERSMNGKALASDSKEMIAMLAYIQWLSTGVPVGVEVVGRGMPEGNTALKPNASHGKAVYAEKCASCHGASGGGTPNPAGGYFFPPVWGNASFNIGAGMARTYTAAGFIKQNMPLGQGGTLSDQDAVDVAEYMTHQPRPAYAAAKNDYAKGVKPKDARN